MTSEQILKMQGWTDENIAKLQAITGNQEAYQYAMRTKDLNGAYEMTKPKEKEEKHNLLEFFSSFSDEHHEDAKSLSIALTKFARWVQSETDKKKAL